MTVVLLVCPEGGALRLGWGWRILCAVQWVRPSAQRSACVLHWVWFFVKKRGR